MFEEETNNLAEEAENVEQTTEEMKEEEVEITDDSNTEKTEDVETSTEEPVEESEPAKIYTEDEFNERFDAKFKRREAKIRKEYEKKYSKLENILNAGLGTSTLEEATTKLNDFYKQKGIDIPEEPKYSDEDTEKLANMDAEEIFSTYSFDEMIEEGDRLAALGNNMSKREKLVLEKLNNKVNEISQLKELSAIGVSEEQVKDPEFKEFAKKLNPSLSLKEKYEMYQSTKPKKEIKKMESMKSGATNTDLKDYYTYEEASKFTDSDYKKHPELYEIIERSMQKWK